MEERDDHTESEVVSILDEPKKGMPRTRYFLTNDINKNY